MVFSLTKSGHCQGRSLYDQGKKELKCQLIPCLASQLAAIQTEKN